MKIISFLLLFVSATALLAQGPQKAPYTKYRKLWEQSLITEKPIIEPEEEELPSVLDDYVLAGWTQTTQGYIVSLINTKDPKGRLTIAPGMPNAGRFQVVEVKTNPLQYKESQVLVKVGDDEKWIGYEDKYLTLQQPPSARKPTSNQSSRQQTPQQRQAQQRQAQQRQTQQRQTQQRQVPIPTNNSNASRSRSGQGSSTQRTPRVRRVPTPPRN